MQADFSLVVLGGGPGGYVAAIRAAQCGLKVALVEERALGGTCLNRGCIPSKALISYSEQLRSFRNASRFGIQAENLRFDYTKMQSQKDGIVERLRRGVEGLVRANQIALFTGRGSFVSPQEIKVQGAEPALLRFEKAIIATGSEPRPLSIAPVDGVRIHDSTTLLSLNPLPKSLLIVGGGVIGCEFASLFAALDVKVTLLEMLPTLVAPEGKEIGQRLASAFKQQGIDVRLGVQLASLKASSTGVEARFQEGEPLAAEMGGVVVGRKYNTENIGLEKAGVFKKENGAIPVNAKMQTNQPHIFAIGDVTGEWLVAHAASHEGVVAAEVAAGKEAEMDYRAVPSVIFTHPEVATVGYTLERALAEGRDAVVGQFPFQALGKAIAIGHTDGFAQVVQDRRTGELLGAQVMGHEASTLIAEMTLALRNELTTHEIAETIHAHPTLPEAWLEATLLAQGRPLHFPPKKSV